MALGTGRSSAISLDSRAEHSQKVRMVRKKWVQFAAVMGFALCGVFLILFLADLWMIKNNGTTAVNRCVLQVPKWAGCVIANHENLSGGLFGAWGTILAGFFAYMAAISEIEATRHVEEKTRAEAKIAAVFVLGEPAFAAGKVLLLVRRAEARIAEQRPWVNLERIDEDPKVKTWFDENIQPDFDVIARRLTALNAVAAHFTIAQAWQGLSVRDQIKFILVAAPLNALLTNWINQVDQTASQKLTTLKYYLERIGISLDSFDGELGKLFEKVANDTFGKVPPTGSDLFVPG